MADQDSRGLSSLQTNGIGQYVRILRRGLPVVVITTLVVAGLGLFLSLQQAPVYEGTAEVFYSSAGNVSSDAAAYADPVRTGQTQAALARVPTVLRRTLVAVGESPGATHLLEDSSVTPAPNADLLTFTVRNGNRGRAARLATAYATAYTSYRRELDTATYRRAIAELQQRLDELRAQNATRTRVYGDLVSQYQALRTREALQASNSSLVRRAESPDQIQPRPVRNTVLAAILGGLLGIGLAFMRSALATHLRSAAEVEERLGLPLLGRLGEPPKRLRSQRRLTMLEEPETPEGESFRMLAANIDFMNVDRGARTIMITSAERAEGKSTTIANLAVAFARSGRHVVIVDLDLRRPTLGRFFGVDDDLGLTHVALGHAQLHEALVEIPLGDDETATTDYHGRLEVLPAGILPVSPAEFTTSLTLTHILVQLAERADLVLVDAPPMLYVSDAMALAAKVDAVLVATHLSVIRRSTLAELSRMLDAAPVAKLGFVATGAAADEVYTAPQRYYYGEGMRSGGRREARPVRGTANRQ